MNRMKRSSIGLVFGTALLGMLTGCVSYVDAPRPSKLYAQPPPVYVESPVVAPDDYVYYPGYQVYYGGNTRQYVYLEGNEWVRRPAPPRVAPNVLFASPSVRLDFHDSPARHHATVARTYPRNWAPPGPSHGNQRGNYAGQNRDQRRGY